MRFAAAYTKIGRVSLHSPSLLKQAQSFVDDLDKPSSVADHNSVQKHVASGDEGGTAKRGSELRDFGKFLIEKDPDASIFVTHLVFFLSPPSTTPIAAFPMPPSPLHPVAPPDNKTNPSSTLLPPTLPPSAAR